MTDIDTLFFRQHRSIHAWLRWILSFLFLLLIVIGGKSHAQAQQDQAEEELPQTTNYALTESLGLLDIKDKGSFGSGVYRGTKRSELTSLLKLVEQSQWQALRPLVRDFILTGADATALDQDIAITPGEDLLTLRLNALLRLGYNREAFELYRKASEHPLDEPTSRTGIFAMLFNQQKGLACLDVKTLAQHHKGIPSWEALIIYCENLLPDSAAPTEEQEKLLSKYPELLALLKSPDYMFEYSPESFAKLDMLERAVLSAQGKISSKYITPQTAPEIPPQDISILLAQPYINDIQKALLLGLAIDYAIMPPQSLSEFYEELLNQHDENKNSKTDASPAISSSEFTNDLLALASIYKETIDSLPDKDRAEKISQAMMIAHKHSDNLLIPLLPIIGELKINTDISIEDAFLLAPLYLYTPDEVSKTWINDLLNINFPDDMKKETTREKLLISLFLLLENIDEAPGDKVYEYIFSASLQTSLLKDIKNIIENIDSTPTNSDKVRTKDTNGFDLIADKGYTMPPNRALSALKSASNDQDISVSLLLSSYILSNIDREKINTEILADIASALNNLGIKTAPRRILAQALMQQE